MQAEAPKADAATSPRLRLLERALCGLRDVEPMVLHSGYATVDMTTSDVDCFARRRFLPAAASQQLHAAGLSIIQHTRYEATGHDFTLAAREADGSWTLLRLDLASDFRFSTDRLFSGRVFLSEEDLTRAQRANSGTTMPSSALEFAYIVVKRVAKRSLGATHARRLTTLYRRNPSECRAVLQRFWGTASVDRIARAATEDDWATVRSDLGALRSELLRRTMLRAPGGVVTYWLADLARLVGRWRHPTGLHVVFLGADGSGKSSVISEVAGELREAFSSVETVHAPPILFGRRRSVGSATDPHALPPRSLPSSISKALVWFVDFTLGYAMKTRPALVRSRLVLSDRYLADVLVDARRYRYGGPAWLPRFIWRLVPKPDLVILLDAPAGVLRARKQEVSVAEAERQRAAYLRLVGDLPNGRTVDASQPLGAVVDDVRTILIEFLAERTAKRLALPVRR